MKIQQYLSGIDGLGPVEVEKRVFVQPWEAQLFGVHSAMMGTGIWAWPDLRVRAEAMNPLDYFKYRYYIKWLGGMTDFLVKHNYITEKELDEKTKYYLENPDAPLPDTGNADVTQRVVDYFYTGDNPYRDVVVNPRFKEGDRVRVNDMPAAPHTRLPGCFRNKVGIVDRVYEGAWLYSASVPTDGLGVPQPIYLVRFGTRDVWNDIPDTKDLVYFDFFDVYLSPAE
ncbi:nitrile hydratase subunit beta [Paraburkholderia caribensis]|uniref:nitrile hydratase subunit beta n=1 Tax=Paraburkholderia TaxID=1822464 RepID=UPI001CAE7ABB|nr:nitrile hydratase subunit beta [Paraburkholderia caribensis]BEU25610.1 nitrile hydratase subunit beta [Paraburkholderia sp. 22B1P]CAG9262539.1 Nitrile hydratase [Paraburkholderia caribensis]